MEDKSNSVKKLIYRAHFLNWPDYGALNAEQFIELLQGFTEHQNSIKEKCPIIHCRAGVGRTGSLAVAVALADMIKQGRVTNENYGITIDTLVLAGRYQRGINFVQSQEQYQSLHLLAKKMLNLN